MVLPYLTLNTNHCKYLQILNTEARIKTKLSVYNAKLISSQYRKPFKSTL